MTYTQSNPPPVPESPLSVNVTDLTYYYQANAPKPVATLTDCNIQVPHGSLTLLIGSNGSGKSTLLRILSGRHLTERDDKVLVLGMPSFRSNILNFHRTHIDTDWGSSRSAFGASTPLTADVKVSEMMEKLQLEYPDRGDKLRDVLGINLNWRMHCLSLGQRRRVQIYLSLLRPFSLLLLDEVTTSLDVCVRQDFLEYLKDEVKSRPNCSVIYATHIFDGLDDWATHLIRLTDNGRVPFCGAMEDCQDFVDLKATDHRGGLILNLSQGWMRTELNRRKELMIMEGESYGEGADVSEAKMSPTDRQGGYAAGRGVPQHVLDKGQGQKREITDEEREFLRRGEGERVFESSGGRLADVMGNAGGLNKHFSRPNEAK